MGFREDAWIKKKLGSIDIIQGAPIKKTIHLERFIISVTVIDFFHQIYGFRRGGFRPRTQPISLQYLLWFKNCNHLTIVFLMAQPVPIIHTTFKDN